MRIKKVITRLGRMDLTTVKGIRISGLSPMDPLTPVYIGGALEGEVPLLPAKGEDSVRMAALVLVPHQWRAPENWRALDIYNNLSLMTDAGLKYRLAIMMPDGKTPWLAEIADLERSTVCVEGRSDYYLDLLLYKR